MARDKNSILQLEVKRFNDPMNSELLSYLVSKYGSNYLFVVDISGNIQLDAYIFAGLQNETELYIFSVAVDENFENQGWGNRLLQRIIKTAQICKITSIQLHVDQTNYSALSLYGNLGFRPKNLALNYYGRNKHAIIMKLKLN